MIDDEEEDPLGDMSTLEDSLAYTKTTKAPLISAGSSDVQPQQQQTESSSNNEQNMWDFII